MRIHRLLPALLLLLALLLHMPIQAANAQAPERETIDLEALHKDRREKAGKYPVETRISRYLGAAAKAVDEGDVEKGKGLLNKLRPKRMNPYERALVYRMLAYIAYGADESEEAIGYFKKVLAEETLPIRDETKVRFNIAQLNASIQQWREVITWLNSWLLYAEEPDPLGFYLMSIAYYQLQDFDSAIVQANKAIELSPEPREAWLRLLAALYSQNQDYEHAGPVLEELVLRFPKKQYWVQLSLIYGARDDYRLSLAVQQVAYTQGLLTEDKELRRLARSYLYHDLPFPAANVLAKGIEDGSITADAKAYELLANSLIAAREYERSLPPLRKAAERSENGDLFVRLGQVHMQREEWREASDFLEKAIEKGELKNPGNAVLLLGITYYNDKHPDRARRAFERARKHESARSAANGWITHLETEAEGPAG